ncbi:MAG: TlpA family protein disulfide reductase [Gemmatimonadales bacterium]|nr:TlpA family protein disulfide reductase [Gemmatimonadales bacterium]MYG49854.1 TlpA family protein disulfide reductase [Gemmatimonadales bacterium]MYK03226.1 TlpA family protein disulfide reductase [Candidatus Palauibacter ramosifaciens]
MANMRPDRINRASRAAAAGVAAALCVSCESAPTGRDRLLDAAAAIERLSSLAYEYAYEGSGSAAGSYTGRVRLLSAADEPRTYWAELRPSPSWTAPPPDDSPPDDPPTEAPALIVSGGGDYVAALDEALGRFHHGTISGGSGHLVANAPFAVLPAFTDPQPFQAELAGDMELVSRETIGGVLCDVLRGRTDEFGPAQVWWHVGVEDDLPRAFRWEADDGSGALAFEIRSMLVDPVLSAEQLAIRVDLDGPDGGEVIDEDERRIEPGVPAPDWTLETASGSAFRLSELRGDIVVLSFGASWCALCRDLAAAYAALPEQAASERVRFLNLNAWESPEVDPGPIVREWGLDAPLLLRAERIASDYKLASVPALFVVDAAGDLALVRHPTLADAEAQAGELERTLRTLLDADR